MKTNSKKDQLRYAATMRMLKRETSRRKTAEKKLKTCGELHKFLLGESRKSEAHLRHLTRKIILTQEEERKEISRELHDEIGQTLSGINVHLATLKIEAAANTAGPKKINTLTQKLVEKSVNMVHRFARNLRPTLLDDLGLVPALQSYIKDFIKRTGIHTTFKTTPEVEKLNFIRRTVLYRVVQAALANVAQHAKASRATVTIQKKQQLIHMEIKDDGKSFNVERVMLAKKINRLGLLGMRERIEMVGGQFTVKSEKGTGTTIKAEVPNS